MNDSALNYEYLIRRAFQCARYGVPGANADTFRALERSSEIAAANTDPTQHDNVIKEYAFDCGEVATYIVNALEKFAKDFEVQLTQTQNQEVEDILTLLSHAAIVDIEQAIQRAQALMIAHGRFPQ